MATIATLNDPFNGTVVNAAIWSAPFGTVTEGSGALTVTCQSGSQFSGIYSNAVYDLTSSAIYVAVKNVTMGNANVLTAFQLLYETIVGTNNGNYLDFLLTGTTITARYGNAFAPTAVASATYSSTTHKYLRISHSGSTITWWTSPDNVTWTSFGTVPLATVSGFISITSMVPQMTTQYSSLATGSSQWFLLNTIVTGTSSFATRKVVLAASGNNSAGPAAVNGTGAVTARHVTFTGAGTPVYINAGGVVSGYTGPADEISVATLGSTYGLGGGISWMGYTWEVENWGGGVLGSGGSNPSASNVFIDGNGYLNLKVAQVAGAWHGAEVNSVRGDLALTPPANPTRWGWGTYRWVIDGDITTWDKQWVLGLFTYWATSKGGPPGQDEIDAPEISSWSLGGAPQYVQVGYFDSASANHVVNQPGLIPTTGFTAEPGWVAQFTWMPAVGSVASFIRFQVWPNLTGTGTAFMDVTYHNGDAYQLVHPYGGQNLGPGVMAIPQLGAGVQLMMNFWPSPGATDTTPSTAILRSFTYTQPNVTPNEQAAKVRIAGTGTQSVIATVTGTGNYRTAAARLASAGTESFPGTGAVTAKHVTLAATGTPLTTGTLAIAAKHITLTSAGLELFTGTAPYAARRATLTGAGLQTYTSTSTVTAKHATLAGLGNTGGPGQVVFTVKRPVLAAAGTVSVSGTSAYRTTPARVSGLGNATQAALAGQYGGGSRRRNGGLR